MGWAPNPLDERAAQEAAAAAAEQARARDKAVASQPMSPYQRKLIGVLEDIRDRLQPLVGPPVYYQVLDDGLTRLVDAPPADMRAAVKAAAIAIWAHFPTISDSDMVAEIAIDAALMAVLSPSAGAGARGDGRASAPHPLKFPGQEAAGDGAGGGESSTPPSEQPH